jgi:hypothetical protein
MRLPTGEFSQILNIFAATSPLLVVGALSHEQRSIGVPSLTSQHPQHQTILLRVLDPEDGFPNYSAEIAQRIESRREELAARSVVFRPIDLHLLSTEDTLLDLILELQAVQGVETVILDISALPKRIWCFVLKRLMISDKCPNLVVSYTEVGSEGYTPFHLSTDPLAPEALPGFASRFNVNDDVLVISVGFEALRVRSLIEVYQERQRETRFYPDLPGLAYLRPSLADIDANGRRRFRQDQRRESRGHRSVG